MIYENSAETDLELLNFLQNLPADPALLNPHLERVNERIHAWMPGLKTVIPLPYAQQVDSAAQTLPIMDNGTVNWTAGFEEVEETDGYASIGRARVWHASLTRDASAMAAYAGLALVLASVYLRVVNRDPQAT